MNKDRRKQIDEAVALAQQAAELIEQLKEAAETIRDDEQEYFGNMPESIQQGDKGQAAEEAISALDEAVSALDEIDIEGVVANLETAANP
jgi:hypothetical protein